LVSGSNNVIQENIVNQFEIGFNFDIAENYFSEMKTTNNTMVYSGLVTTGNFDGGGSNIDIP